LGERKLRISVQLHSHSQMTDGYFTVSGLLKVMSELYDVVAITDHNVVTVPHPLQLQGLPEDFLILKGVEVTFPQLHIICIEPSVFNMGVVGLIRSAEVSYIAHPSFSFLTPEMCLEICEKEGLDGVEVYNSDFVNFEDTVGLSENYNLYAGDDLHIHSQLGTSWIEMNVDSITKEEVLEKLKSGDFEVFRKEMETLKY